MKKCRFALPICILLLLAWTGPAMSASEWQILHTLKLEHKPVDMIVSADKSRIYILTDQGRLLIYGANGKYKDAIEVGGDVDQIKQGPGNNTLFLLSRKNATIQMVRVSIIEAIDTLNAPFKGTADAPASVVVFSDFQ